MVLVEGKVEIVLIKLGIDIDRHRGDEILALCPGHELRTGEPDHSPSWSINTESGLHHCFSCGYKGNLLTLVAEVQGYFSEWNRLDLDLAKNWLSNNTDVDLDALVKRLDLVKDSYISIAKPVPMDEARLSLFDPTIPTWALDARNLTQEACNQYGVRWDTRTGSWILPIRVMDSGKLLGWQEKGQVKRHFMNRPTGVAKSTTLFTPRNLHIRGQLMENVFSNVIVVESPLDAVRISGIPGMPDAVATYGASISEAQIALLRAADNIIIAMDNDKAGRASAERMLRMSRNGLECSFFNYERLSVKDVGDMTDEQIISGIANARHCVLGMAALG